MTQLLQMIPYGAGVNGSLAVTSSITGSQSKASWVAASYPLTQGAFILIGD
jgi:hypothetical protein